MWRRRWMCARSAEILPLFVGEKFHRMQRRRSGQWYQPLDAVVGNGEAPLNEASGIATTTKGAPQLVQEALIPDFRA